MKTKVIRTKKKCRFDTVNSRTLQCKALSLINFLQKTLIYDMKIKLAICVAKKLEHSLFLIMRLRFESHYSRFVNTVT